MAFGIIISSANAFQCYEKCITVVKDNCSEKCFEVLNKRGTLLILISDIVFLISALVVGILSATHIIPLPPAGTYSFFGAAALIFLIDSVAITHACLKT